MSMVMAKMVKGMGFLLKVIFVGVLLIGNLIMDLIGILVCAITSQN